MSNQANNPLEAAGEIAGQVVGKVHDAVASPLGQQIVAGATKVADQAVDVGTEAALQAICAKYGLPYDAASKTVHAVADHFGIHGVSDLFSRLAKSN